MVNPNPESIVICYGCAGRVRAKVTRIIPTGEDEDLRRWCLQCIADVDQTSDFLLPGAATDQSVDSSISKFLLDDEG